MRCLRCQNEDLRFFAFDQGTWYCRKCIAFGRLNADTPPPKPKLSRCVFEGQPQLAYELTPNQKKASHEAYTALSQGKDVLVYAAAGAGKTEMTFESITNYLHAGKKVCFAISRRQVVLEIAVRLAQAFPSLSVIAVCEGHTKVLDADLIVCTIHQLYRYPDCFDLLILDELDAFPFVGDPVLQALADGCCHGQRLLLSATPDPESLEKIEAGKMVLVQLFERPHHHPVIVPRVYTLSKGLQLLLAFVHIRRFVKADKQVLLFVPRRRDIRWLVPLFNLAFTAKGIHSGSADKDSVLDAFRAREFPVLLATTLLERGITVPSVQVVVLFGDHIVFTAASLIQIFGRAGRSFQDPRGEGICLCQKKTASIRECVRQLEYMNRCVYGADWRRTTK